MPDTIHIRPSAPVAERVLLPGDPGRALRLAQALLREPKMLNHNRGLWGYSGTAADGELLTIQSTGMGGPTTAIIVSELVELGARRLLRIGTCGGLDPTLEVGALVIASEAICEDGTSRALGAGERAGPSPSVLAALRAAGDRARAGGLVVEGPIVSTDLFYDAGDREPGWVAAGAIAVEMEAATVFALAAKRGVESGCALLVSNMLVGDRTWIPADRLHAAELRLGELAITALS